MARWFLTASFALPLTAFAAPALAADDCPPGSWFCEEVTLPTIDQGDDEDAEEAAPPPKQPKQVTKKALRDDDELATSPDDPPEASAGTEEEPQKAPPPKKKKSKKKHKKHKKVEVEASSEANVTTKRVEVESEDGADTVVIVKHKKAAPAPERARKKKKQRRWREHFGLNLRLDGATIMNQDGDLVGMGGAGLSFRWRPSPYFAIDLGTDLIGGSDYNNDQRIEVAGGLSGIVYFNPQHRVQVYGIGGINLAHAEVETSPDIFRCDFCTSESDGRNYFGGHGGLGLEFRIARHFGMFVDGLAIVRKRIDSDQPEFRDPESGATTNVSGAGLFRTGVNFWW